jgi:ubiquinone/menaquinone biosynthesis C-methylase UbiE
MQKLLPPQRQRLIEIGAGFGRLADLYHGYQQVVLNDYARTQLEEAQNYLGHDKRFIYVVSDIYNMPFVDNLFDALTMVRVMHHLADVPAACSPGHSSDRIRQQISSQVFTPLAAGPAALESI